MMEDLDVSKFIEMITAKDYETIIMGISLMIHYCPDQDKLFERLYYTPDNGSPCNWHEIMSVKFPEFYNGYCKWRTDYAFNRWSKEQIQKYEQNRIKKII